MIYEENTMSKVFNRTIKNQNHVKAVDNLRRTTGATKDQLQRMFQQINAYV